MVKSERDKAKESPNIEKVETKKLIKKREHIPIHNETKDSDTWTQQHAMEKAYNMEI